MLTDADDTCIVTFNPVCTAFHAKSLCRQQNCNAAATLRTEIDALRCPFWSTEHELARYMRLTTVKCCEKKKKFALRCSTGWLGSVSVAYRSQTAKQSVVSNLISAGKSEKKTFLCYPGIF